MLFLYTINGVRKYPKINAVNILSKVPAIAASIISFSSKFDISDQVAGTCPIITDNGNPEQAMTKEPTTNLGSSTEVISISCAMAKVGLASIDKIPVDGSINRDCKREVKASSIGFHIPI